MSSDYLIRISRIDYENGLLHCQIVGSNAPIGFHGAICRSPDARMDSSRFFDVASKAGEGGYILADQVEGDGRCRYITKLKAKGERKRIFYAPLIGIDLLSKDSKGGRSKIETAWELFKSNTSHTKINALITVLKSDVQIFHRPEQAISEMGSIFNSLRNQSYTPKLIIRTSGGGAHDHLEIAAARSNGQLDWPKTAEKVFDAVTRLNGQPFFCHSSVAIRMSDLSSQKMIKTLLHSTAIGKGSKIVEHFFANTRRDGMPLYAPGYVLTGVGSDYEYGESARMLEHGQSLTNLSGY